MNDLVDQLVKAIGDPGAWKMVATARIAQLEAQVEFEKKATDWFSQDCKRLATRIEALEEDIKRWHDLAQGSIHAEWWKAHARIAALEAAGNRLAEAVESESTTKVIASALAAWRAVEGGGDE